MKFNLLLLCVFFPFLIFAEVIFETEQEEGFFVQIDVFPQDLTVDKKLQVTLNTRSPEGYSLNRADVRANLLRHISYGPAPFILLAEERAMQKDGILKIIYTLDPETSGTHELSLGRLVFTKDKGNSIYVLTPVFTIDVSKVDAERSFDFPISSLLDIAAEFPIEVSPVNEMRFIMGKEALVDNSRHFADLMRMKRRPWIVLALLITGSALFFVTYVLFLMRRKKHKAITVDLPGAKQLALGRLRVLMKKRELEGLMPRTYFYNLTHLLRHYLEMGRGVRAKTATTEEFLDFARKSHLIEQSEKEFLSQFLMMSDRVKFAKFHPTEDILTQAEKSLKTFFES